MGMSVLSEGISVIARIQTIDAKYLGGVTQYERDCPNATFCMDENLIRVGFMTPPDVRTFVRNLERIGLILHDGKQFVDMAIVDQLQGPTMPCNWLEGGRHERGFTAIWLVGTNPNPMAAPRGWTVERVGKMRFVPNEEVPSRLMKIAEDGPLDIVLDYATGKEMYIGRSRQR